jgi:hypothetical protein
MATRKDKPNERTWAEAEELFARGDSEFVDRIRAVYDAGRLGSFAVRWFADRRPEARRMLCDYLSRPLNAYRHEALVKRLFKLAEQANDDELMARFLVAFDRSRRRIRRRRWDVRSSEIVEKIASPSNSTMPRDLSPWAEISPPLRDWLERRRLFSVRTRNYLRRRAWRYFRKLGKEHPRQYVKAVMAALRLYEDEDVTDSLALLDNWGLVHILFHHAPALQAKPHGWLPAPGHRLAELQPAPMYESLWQASPRSVVDLLRDARCRTIRQWAIVLIRRDPAKNRDAATLDEWLRLLFHDDSEVAALAAELLRDAPGLSELSVDRWLSLLETPNVLALEILCELIVGHVRAERVGLADAVRLGCSRPVPLARLGLAWLQSKHPETLADCRTILGLANAEAESVRPEIVRWAREMLRASPYFEADWLLEFLDSRHADVRAEGWAWLETEPRARENVSLWQRLMESPYDDVRLRLAAALQERVGDRSPVVDSDRLDAELLRFLWASVLLNIHRGGRTKPLVVTQLIRRMESKPDEAKDLLPIVAVALRSVRGPEWRAGLAGVVRLIHRLSGLTSEVNRTFPELKWS